MNPPTPLTDAVAALALGSHELVALTGGGGKTTLMFELGRQLPGRVILTTTTKMSSERTDGFRTVVTGSAEQLAEALESDSKLLVWRREDESKVSGFPPETVDAWFPLADHIVVEADGARSHPFKAPAPYEPPIPHAATTVVSVIGADALGRVIADQCHRPLRVAAVAGCSPYQRLSPERAATVIASRRGGRKNVPESARLVVAITKVDDRSKDLVEALAEELAAREIPAATFANRGSEA